MSSLSDIYDQLSTVCTMLDSLALDLEGIREDLGDAQRSLNKAKKDLLDWALSDFQPLPEEVISSAENNK